MKKTVFLVAAVFLLFSSLSSFASGLQKNPRVVCWGKGSALVLNMLYMFFESKEYITATSSTSQAMSGFLELLDRDYTKKAVLGMEVQAETVAAQNPTHIVLKSYMKKAAKDIKQLGISPLFLEMESPEKYDTDLKRLGELYGNPERARTLRNYFHRERMEVIEKMQKNPDKRPGVLLLYYSMKGGSLSLKVPPGDWLQTRMISWAGGVPVWTDSVIGKGWQTVSFEQIVAWNPHTVFLVTYHTDVEDAKKTVISDPLWQQLSVCRENRVFAFPGDFMSWDQPSPRWILGLNWIGTKLHPSFFPQQGLKQKVYGFYNTAYGLNRAVVDEKILPVIKGDYLQ